jgi:Zn-dependent membrane protease YugP
LMGITSWYVRHAYSKWSQVRATSGLTGHQAASGCLQGNLYGVQIMYPDSSVIIMTHATRPCSFPRELRTARR